MSAWYCSALPPRWIRLQICLWPRRQWSCWQVASQYLVQHLANNYAYALVRLERFEEAKALFRREIPVARRVLGDNHRLALRMRSNYAEAFCKDDGTTLDKLREALTSLEETRRVAWRVLGGAHPVAGEIEENLRDARAALAARETPPPGT